MGRGAPRKVAPMPANRGPLCAACGRAGLQSRRVTRSFGSGEALLVIENIPMWSCPHCAESYFTAQTMHEIERIKALRTSVAVDRQVPVAEFQLA